MTVLPGYAGKMVLSIEDRLARVGLEVVEWGVQGLRLYCTRCGDLFSRGFAGGNLQQPAPKGSWWKCDKGCNASSKNPLEAVSHYESAGKPSSTFDSVIKKR